ncbi:hypothetical protein BpHYR1_009828, partial [Brachionus plicatilis]
HNQFLISTMKKTFNTIRFLLSTKNYWKLAINFCKKSFCAERCEIVLNVKLNIIRFKVKHCK